MKKLVLKFICISFFMFIVLNFSVSAGDEEGSTTSDNSSSQELSNEMDEYQEAFVEVAKQYTYRGASIGFNDYNMFKGGGFFGDIRLSTNGTSNWFSSMFAPEDAYNHNTVYTNCSQFAWQVYNEAFCTQLLPLHLQTTAKLEERVKNEWQYDSDLVPYYKHDITGNETDEEIENELEAIKSILQVGDIVLFRRTNGTGHTMMYVGKNNPYDPDGYYYINSDHASDEYAYNLGYKRAALIKESSPRYSSTSDWFDRSAKSTHFLFYKKDGSNPYWVNAVMIIRPLALVRRGEYSISEVCFTEAYTKSKNRLKYEDLVITKTSSKERHDTVGICDEITYTVKLENKSNNDYTIPLKLEIPEHTELVSEPIPTSVNLGAKSTKTIEYTVKIKSDNSLYGKYIENTGSVGGIKLNTLKNKIANNLNEEDAKTLKERLIEGTKYKDNAEMISSIYNLPYLSNLTADDYINSVLHLHRKEDTSIIGYTLANEDEIENAKLHDIMVENLYGGYLVSNLVVDSFQSRPRDIMLYDLNVGDILTVISTTQTDDAFYDETMWKKDQYIYIGDAKLATVKDGKVTIINVTDQYVRSGNQLIASLLGEVAFTVHRPSNSFLIDANTCSETNESQIISDIPNTSKNNQLIILIVPLTLLGVGISISSYIRVKKRNII